MRSKDRFIDLLNKCFPQRYLVAVMSFIGVVIGTSLRVNMSMVLKGMSGSVGNQNPCYNITKISKIKEICKEESLVWDEELQGSILCSFYIGFLLSHFPGAYFSRKIGGKYTLGISILACSLVSILVVPAACYSANALFAIRFMTGLVEGPMFASVSELMSEWAPPSERTLLNAITFGGIQVGIVVSMAIAGQILKVMEWPNLFFIFGMVGVIWFVLWIFVCYSKPSLHPFISTSELAYLTKNIPEADKSMSTPWKALLKSRPVWVLVIAEMGHDYALYTMVADLPKYYCSQLHYDISRIGAVTSLPFLAMWILSVLVGYSCDKIIDLNEPENPRANLRRLMGTLGAAVPGIGMVCASYVDNDKCKIVLITMSVAFMAGYYCSIPGNILDLSPNHAATIMAMLNCVGDIFGVLAISTNSAITKYHTNEEWRNVFWIMLAMLVITNIPYALWASGDVQPWDKPKKDPTISDGQRRSSVSGGELTNKKCKIILNCINR